MTPDELCRSNSEHGHQRALFAWLAMAEQHGFVAAWDDATYSSIQSIVSVGVPELKWIHAIPNGGLRDKRTAAMLKAEGVKRGIPDVFLPLPCWGTVTETGHSCIMYAGLYVEMKRPDSDEKGRKGRTSAFQEDAISWLRHSGYAVSVCFDWRSAAKEIERYVDAVRRKHLTR